MPSYCRASRRTAATLTIAVLLLALVFSACAGRGAVRSGSGITQHSGSNAALNADVSALTQADAQIQAALSAADDAQNAASQDQSLLDSEQAP
jgi:hypothetical protein